RGPPSITSKACSKGGGCCSTTSISSCTCFIPPFGRSTNWSDFGATRNSWRPARSRQHRKGTLVGEAADEGRVVGIAERVLLEGGQIRFLCARGAADRDGCDARSASTRILRPESGRIPPFPLARIADRALHGPLLSG